MFLIIGFMLLIYGIFVYRIASILKKHTMRNIFFFINCAMSFAIIIIGFIVLAFDESPPSPPEIDTWGQALWGLIISLIGIGMAISAVVAIVLNKRSRNNVRK